LNAAAVLLFLLLSLITVAFLAVAAFFLIATVYFAYARWRFSRRGGDLQGQIRQLVLDRVVWNGRGTALDIGCGNGPLVIELARRHPGAHITGVDPWGGLWDYAKTQCEMNARLEGVAERVAFQQASAASLPFADGSFDLVVSNLAFHEVRGIADRTLVLREALRVLRPGGGFVFQDLFKMKRMYGATDDLLRQFQSWGIAKVEFEDTGSSPLIPKAFRLPFMLGTLGIFHGVK
jgi:ubiquinone/menaquinone biosynthesis C-methylase UbiE